MNPEKRKIIIIAIMLLAGSVIAMKVLSSFKTEKPRRSPKENIRFVKVDTVQYRAISSKVVANGRLESSQQVEVITEVQGKILSGDVDLKKGGTFKKGAILFRVFNAEARLNLLALKSRFLNTIAHLLPDLKIDFPNRYSHWKHFLESIDIKKDLPQCPSPTSRKEKVFLAGRNILSEYYAIKSDEIRLKKYTIKAPFGGAFSQVNLEVGAVANPGAKVARIIRTDLLELEVPVDVHNAHWIQVKDEVTVQTDDGSRQWTGTVVRKSPFVDPQTQSASVFIQIKPSSDTPLFSGLYLKAIFSGILIDQAMELPRNAVFNNNEVFVVKDNRLAKAAIHILKVDEQTLAFKGLEPGTIIVREPLINAHENEAVKIMK